MTSTLKGVRGVIINWTCKREADANTTRRHCRHTCVSLNHPFLLFQIYSASYLRCQACDAL